MPLLKLFEAAKNDVLKLSIEAILQTAGGKLLDGNTTSKEFRSFLEQIESDDLFKYARQCLDKDSKFADKGLVLQDIVNDVGRRLEFDVEPGLYHGKVGAIGYDGIWRDKKKNTEIIIEVKTASHITIKLETIANYKRQLVKEGRISENASTLIVVGREGTAPIEAQIRGSRYAWEMRLISVKSLLNLLHIKLKYDDDTTINMIKEILKPFEYTKIDKIIDIVFTTAENEDIASQNEDIPDTEDEDEHAIKKFASDPEVINKKRSIAIQSVAKHKGISLLQRRKSLFWDQSETRRACISVSKCYSGNYYWYGHRKNHKDFLESGEESYVILVCIDREECFVIPYDFVKENLPNLYRTSDEKGWHIKIEPDSQDAREVKWNMAKIGTKKSISQFAIPMITKPDESS